MDSAPLGLLPPLFSPDWVSLSVRQLFLMGQCPPSCLWFWPPPVPSDDGRFSASPSHRHQRYSHCPQMLLSAEADGKTRIHVNWNETILNTRFAMVCIKILTAWLRPPGLLSVWGSGICWRGWCWWGGWWWWWWCSWFLLESVEATDSQEDWWGSEACFCACGLGWTFLTSWLWGRGPKIWPTWK